MKKRRTTAIVGTVITTIVRCIIFYSDSLAMYRKTFILNATRYY
ncbi:hypothetical protein [uncultured Dysgonomonas sp.]|nr:hypothetical protein [uncultured Dysgonomonas sp.]